MLQPFRVLIPEEIIGASTELARLGEKAVVYAGGAELALLLRYGMIRADYLVNIKRIRGMNEITWDGETIQIGAAMTHHRVETDPLIRRHMPLFAYAEGKIANIRVRNQGTLGGNLCFNDPHSDPGTALLLYDTSVSLANKTNWRQLPLCEFLTGMYSTALMAGEILASVAIKPLPLDWGTAYLRVHRLQRPTLNVAVATKLKDGILEKVRMAVGCVGPKPQRLLEIEDKIVGLKIEDANKIIMESTRYFVNLLEPVDDVLGSTDYKMYMTRILLSRALSQASAAKEEV
ncbi:MAG: FAD binding domain-containing protein [Deltaproteobacteria bacterium]|nr:FAD binding domain-containing protein [Deltaproteobacteria bacterium]